MKKSNFNLPGIKTVSYGFESIRYLGPKIWKLVPDELKGLTSLETFKKKVKSLKFEQCPCNLCRNHIHKVGYIDWLNARWSSRIGIRLYFLCSTFALVVLVAYILILTLFLYDFERIIGINAHTRLLDFIVQVFITYTIFDTNYLVLLYVMYHVCCLCFCVRQF